MNKFFQVLTNLQRAKDNYMASLRSVDSELRVIVSQDPSQLAGARAIQASYTDDIVGAELAASEQPATSMQWTVTADDVTTHHFDKPKAKRERKPAAPKKDKKAK